MRNKNQVKPMGMCQRFSLWQLHCVEQQSLSSRSWSKSWGQVAKDGCYQAGWWANRLGQSVCHQDQEIWSGTAWQSNEIWTLSTSNHTRGGPKTRTGQGLHKLDLSSGYWHFELYECQATWQHLIHHLACIGGADCLSEWVSHKKKFQKHVWCIADDVIVYGKGDNLEDANPDHGQNLENLLLRCREKGIKLNIEKTELWHLYLLFMSSSHRERLETRPFQNSGNEGSVKTNWCERSEKILWICKLSCKVPAQIIGCDGTYSPTLEKWRVALGCRPRRGLSGSEETIVFKHQCLPTKAQVEKC